MSLLCCLFCWFSTFTTFKEEMIFSLFFLFDCVSLFISSCSLSVNYYHMNVSFICVCLLVRL